MRPHRNKKRIDDRRVNQMSNLKNKPLKNVKNSQLQNFDDDEKIQTPLKENIKKTESEKKVDTLADFDENDIEELEFTNPKVRTIEILRKLLDKKKVNFKNAFDYDIEDLTKLDWFRNLQDDTAWKGITTAAKNNKDLLGYKTEALEKMYHQMLNLNHNRAKKDEQEQHKEDIELCTMVNLAKDVMKFLDGKETLEKNELLTRNVNFNSVISQDPLIAKLSEKFEESGANGLMMKNLYVDYKNMKFCLDTIENKEETNFFNQKNKKCFGQNSRNEPEEINESIFTKQDLQSRIFSQFKTNLQNKNLCTKLTDMRAKCEEDYMNQTSQKNQNNKNIIGFSKKIDEDLEFTEKKSNYKKNFNLNENFFNTNYKNELMNELESYGLDFPNFDIFDEPVNFDQEDEGLYSRDKPMCGAFSDEAENSFEEYPIQENKFQYSEQKFFNDAKISDKIHLTPSLSKETDFNFQATVKNYKNTSESDKKPSVLGDYTPGITYNILEKIEAAFGKGKVYQSCNEENYMDPAEWSIAKKRAKRIVGIKNKSKKNAKEKNQVQINKNKLNFIWDLLEIDDPYDITRNFNDLSESNFNKKVANIKPPLHSKVLEKVNRNMTGMDYCIKPDKFNELFNRLKRPPEIMLHIYNNDIQNSYSEEDDSKVFSDMGDFGVEENINFDFGIEDMGSNFLSAKNDQALNFSNQKMSLGDISTNDVDQTLVQKDKNNGTFKITDLKESIWKIMSTIQKTNDSDIKVSFEEVYKEIYEKFLINKKHVTIQSAFQAILHMSNERGFKLNSVVYKILNDQVEKSDSGYQSFEIEQI